MTEPEHCHVLKCSAIIENMRYTNTIRSEEDSHQKNSVLPFPGGKGMPCKQGPHGEAPELVRRQREWEWQGKQA